MTGYFIIVRNGLVQLVLPGITSHQHATEHLRYHLQHGPESNQYFYWKSNTEQFRFQDGNVCPWRQYT